MNMLLTIIVTFLQVWGQGLEPVCGNERRGVISPMLITFLGMDPYMAVGIALSSDVLASAVSAYTYGKIKSRYPKRYHHDGERTFIYRFWKLCVKSGPICGHGELFSLYDIPFRN